MGGRGKNVGVAEKTRTLRSYFPESKRVGAHALLVYDDPAVCNLIQVFIVFKGMADFCDIRRAAILADFFNSVSNRRPQYLSSSEYTEHVALSFFPWDHSLFPHR